MVLQSIPFYVHNAHCVRCYCALPRITVPHAMSLKIEKNKLKNAQKERARPIYKSPVVISCKRAKYNHHRGQTYSNFSPQVLASGGWKHYRSKGDHFTIHATQTNPSLENPDGQQMSFSDFGLHKSVVERLPEMNFTRPTNVQALTIPHLMEGDNVLCSAETGSGKTLAFLLPILHSILSKNNQPSYVSEPNKPSAVILTPLRELADQIGHVCESFCHSLPIKSNTICGGRGTQKILRNPPVSQFDIFVSTPGVLSKLLTNRIIDTSRLDHIVFDEADTLFDDSFNALTIRLIQKLKIQSEKVEFGNREENIGTQVALVGATTPKGLDDILHDVLPVEDLVKITTPHLHRLQPHVPQKFVRIGPDNAPEYLLKHLKKNPSVPTLVFCKNSKTAGYVHTMLEENGVSNILLHANMNQRVRQGRFEAFQAGETNVLVCTDLVSRGLDTIRARHVINYNFPEFMSDYIHRVGRVGRVASEGKGFVLSFICYEWDVNLLWQIETAARRSSELHNVNANIKRKLTAIIQRKFHDEQKQIEIT